jgi:hypothetical protein
MRALTVNAVEGAFVSVPNRFGRPYTTLPAGPGALRGGAGGVAVGRFGYADALGRVTNARGAPADRIGLVILAFVEPALNTWQRNYWDETTRTYRVREGTEVTMLTRGAVWVRFAGGAWPAQPVYASTLDGQAFSGYAADAELTGWSVQTVAGPGELAIISQ